MNPQDCHLLSFVLGLYFTKGILYTKSTKPGHLLLNCKRKQISYTVKTVFLFYYSKESRQNSTVEEDSEGDNDSEEFYYGGQVSKPVSQILSLRVSPNSHICPGGNLCLRVKRYRTKGAFYNLPKNLYNLAIFNSLHILRN